jgi:hypothetical protein
MNEEWDQTVDSIEMAARHLERMLRRQNRRPGYTGTPEQVLVNSLLHDIENYWDDEIKRRVQDQQPKEEPREETLPY